MKKKRLIILLSILVVVAVIGCFTYLYRAAAEVKDLFYDFDVTNDKDKESLKRLPEYIELGSNSNPGYTVHFQDYSITLSGYDDIVVDKDLNDDFITMYNVGSDKLISFRNMDLFRNDDYFNDPVISSQINKAAGREINSEYDFFESSFNCTPDDFSLLDAEKNSGVSILLRQKGNMFDSCYQFNNGTVKGFLCAISPDGSLAFVFFSNCDAPDSWYGINCFLFSTEEVKQILSTITFDGSDTN